MILPVRERVLRALERKLASISVDAGYGTTVRRVRRVRTVVVKAADPPEIHIFCGLCETRPRGSEDVWSRMQTFLLFYTRDLGSPTTQYSLMLADIQRCLASGVVDDMAVPLGGPSWEIDVRISHHSDQPLDYEEQEGDVVGLVELDVGFSWCVDDPRKWGLADVLVEAQEE